MKKVLALLLSFTLVFSMVACSSSSEDTEEEAEEEAEVEEEVEEAEEEVEEETEEEETEEEVEEASTDTEDYGDPENASLKFYWWGGQERSEYTTAAIEIYEENHPGVSIETQSYQNSDYWTVMATAAAGDTLPDIMQHDYAYLAQYEASGLNIDLFPFTENGMLDISNISDGIIESGTVNDHLIGVCNGVNAPCMIYNKTLTDSIGLEIVDYMTWDDFAEYSKTIQEETGVMTIYGYSTGSDVNPETYFIREKGYGQMFTDDGLSYEDDGYEVMTEYYQRLIDGVNEGWLMDAMTLSGLDTTSIERNPLVYYSQPEYETWEYCCWSNQLVVFQTAAPEGVELAMTNCPSDNQEASNYEKPSQFFSVTRDTTNVAASVQFLDALINDIDMNLELKGERGVPAPSNVAEALKDAGVLNELEYDYLFNVADPCCSPIYPPLADSTSEVIGGPAKDISEKVLYGEIDADTAAKEFFDQTISIMRGE